MRRDGADQPTLETVQRAAAALLGSATSDVPSDAQFTDLGGDSLSALTFADLLEDIYDVEMPVSVIVSPPTTCRRLRLTSTHDANRALKGPPSHRCMVAARPSYGQATSAWRNSSTKTSCPPLHRFPNPPPPSAASS